MTISSIVSGFIITAIVLYYELKIDRLFKSRNNNVHFYVARDKDSELWLYIGKPVRLNNVFIGRLDNGSCGLTHLNFKCFGLDENDYDSLKWKDDPVEVFLNM